MTYQPSVRTRARPVSHCCLAAAMAAVFAILGGGARAAADYPTKPVRVFVPYGPGGVGDLTMRLLADKLGDQLKQQFVIENRPGAGGIASATQVLRAPADGYTLGEIGNGQSISASLFNKLPFDVLKDFTLRFGGGEFRDAARRTGQFALQVAPRCRRRRKEKSRKAQSRRHQSRQHAKPFGVPVRAGNGSSNLRSSPIARRPSW